MAVAPAGRPLGPGTFGGAPETTWTAGYPGMSERSAGSEAGRRSVREPWIHATVRAAIMLVVSYVVFVLVPNNLLTYLTVHVNTRARDLLMLVWWVASFAFAAWMFVRLQRGRVR